jgi:hypothetical protein
MIVIPNGLIRNDAVDPLRDPTYGNRIQSFTYHLLDSNDDHVGALDQVLGGTLEWHANAPIHGGGKITVVQKGRDNHNWLKRRIKIVMHIDGIGDTPLGVFIPSAPVEKWDDMNLTLEMDLLDKCSVLDNDYVEHTYSAPEGANVTDRVRDLITSTGENAGSITDSNATLNKAMAWDAGTSKLQIINDLLDAANYFSLFADGDGRFRVEKYRLPKDRPNEHFFSDGFQSIYLPEFDYEKDIYSVPNKVILVGQGSGTNEAPVAVATNTDPNSPYSRQSRGRWITDVVSGVEVAGDDLTEAEIQAALDSKAEKRLHELTSPTGTITIDHAPLPWLGINSAVRFKRIEADIDIRAVVTSTQINLDPMELQRTELQEVVEIANQEWVEP